MQYLRDRNSTRADRAPERSAGSARWRHTARRQLTATLAVSCAIVAFGCSKDGGTSTEPSAVAGAASTALGSAPVRTEVIMDLVAIATDAWSAKDATAYASIYAEDAQVINPVGGFIIGRESVRLAHVFLFNGPFAGSTQTISVRSIQFLTGTIAIVDQDVTLTGYAFLPPNGLRATTPGVVRTTVRWVVMKRGGTWEIVAQQMTPIPPTG